MRLPTAVLAGVLLGGCGDGKVTSDEEAELAYVGLDPSVERAMRLGLRGFSEASNANIADQEEAGDLGGTMIVGGQVDQGASDNKTLNLDVTLVDYQDVVDVDGDDKREIDVVYATSEGDPAALALKLSNIPDGTFTGSYAGAFVMAGDLEGEVVLDLSLSGELEPDPEVTDGTRRVVGSTTVTGTVTNERDGVYQVDLAL